MQNGLENTSNRPSMDQTSSGQRIGNLPSVGPKGALGQTRGSQWYGPTNTGTFKASLLESTDRELWRQIDESARLSESPLDELDVGPDVDLEKVLGE